MPTISSKVSQRELEAIVEYANQCGETVSNLTRKILIANATMLDGGWPEEHTEYEHAWFIHDNISSEEEDKMIENYVNKVRTILGWKEIKL